MGELKHQRNMNWQSQDSVWDKWVKKKMEKKADWFKISIHNITAKLKDEKIIAIFLWEKIVLIRL